MLQEFISQALVIVQNCNSGVGSMVTITRGQKRWQEFSLVQALLVPLQLTLTSMTSTVPRFGIDARISDKRQNIFPLQLSSDRNPDLTPTYRQWRGGKGRKLSISNSIVGTCLIWSGLQIRRESCLGPSRNWIQAIPNAHTKVCFWVNGNSFWISPQESYMEN